ncbi:ribose-phosphate pyrophosphokinase 4-like [Helianthus annuus]|uniref:ribose-phosphate pyrophosphokinase 4-like n=1 Tax=Helianthus annuus TaxID=4232 RepID=UPI00165312AD|nr:ribose-phosphate pyrophosphokinase 4-like [Helianthus annuus]
MWFLISLILVLVVCGKVHEGDKQTVRVKEGNPSGCHVVIVYDLVQSGGTLIECQKVLATHGATKVSAYVTHVVFPKNSWKKFVRKNGEYVDVVCDDAPVVLRGSRDRCTPLRYRCCNSRGHGIIRDRN